MTTEIAGITRANEGIQGITWNILGQIYVPKSRTDHSFSWHATFPPGTFVPPHIHPDQDEYLYILEGRLDFMLDGADESATAGDTVRLPMGKPHGIFNKSQQLAKTLFWVSPTRRLYDLFWANHNMKQQNPDEVVKLAAEHNVHFLPPPPARAGRRSSGLPRHHARGKPCSRGVAPHDRFACLVVEDGVDVGEAVRGELLDRIDDALGTAAAIGSDDFGRHG